jgi:PAS domain S-box-containing protein
MLVSPIGMAVVNLSDDVGRFLEVNPALCTMLGYSRDELMALTLADVTHPEDLAEIRRLTHSLVAGKMSSFGLEKRLVTKRGATVWASTTATAVREETTGNLRGLVMIEDISERKRADAALRESEERYRRIVEAGHEGIWTLDAECRTTFANERLAEMLGCPVSEILGCPTEDFLFPEDIPAHQARVEQRRRGAGGSYELRLRRRDGAERWALVTASPVMDKAGRYEGSFAMLTDITERKRTEEELARHQLHLEELVEKRTAELKHAQERLTLEDKLATLVRFANSVAHELRSPLGAIRNASYFLQQTVADKLEGKPLHHLRIVEDSIQRANRAVTMILDFTHPQQVEPKSCPLQPILDRAVAEAMVPANVQVFIEPAAGLPLVQVDERQMVAVFRNLLDNAAQALPQGGTVRVEARPGGAVVVVRVSDLGVGISSEHMARLFEPLFTTRTVGVGLGLSICKTFVETNRGTISVASRPGRGTTFTVTLPKAPDQSARPDSVPQTE